MRRLRLIITVVSVLAGSTAAAAAAAAPPPTVPPACAAMPDVAALDEYCPTLPSADGRGGNRGPRLELLLPRKLVKQLKKSGPIGDLLLGLSAGAPKEALGRGRGPGLDAEDLLRSGKLGIGATEPSGNPLEVVVSALTGGQLNAAFGFVLLLSTLGLSGAGWRRFRARRSVF